MFNKTIGGILIMAFSLFGKTNEEVFWDWFKKNDARLFAFEKDQEKVFDDLAKAMSRVHPDLTFEFGPVMNGIREFVISAGGIKAAFPKIESLYSSAPSMKNWKFTKFRPRRSQLTDIKLGPTTVKQTDVKYLLVKDENPGKVGIVLFITNYSEDQENVYKQAGYLLLDEAIGEYDMETKVGGIQFELTSSKYFSRALPISGLAKDFDETLKSR